MHWSEKIARDIIAKRPDKEFYTCAAGISPSGKVHIGNFRDIATAYFVLLSLRKLGKKCRLLFSWDEYDRFRKVPKDIDAEYPDFYRYIGKPYAQIPDPYGCHASYAEHFEKTFEQSLAAFGIEVDFRYQATEYNSGRYASDIVYANTRRLEIYDIIMDFKTQEASAEERENYYPVSVYCEKCGKDDTTITSCTEDGRYAEYTCKCGHHGHIDFLTQFNAKLAWKIDWPMRWRQEQVDFEPGGKDHAAIGGSYQVSSVISEKIFRYVPPIFQGYEFIGIKGSVGKMSGSSGLNMVPETLLTVYQPEVILWLYSRTEPTRAFDFCFDEEILRQYHEFDRMQSLYASGEADDYTREIMELVQIEGRQIHTVPMAQLTSFGPIVNWQPAMLEELFKRCGSTYTADEFAERMRLAEYWLRYCSPESLITLNTEKNVAYYESIDKPSQDMIRALYAGLAANDYAIDDLNAFLYSIPVSVLGEMTDKEKKKAQTVFFGHVYNLLISRTKGPRLYLFLMAVPKQDYLELLNF